MAVERGPGGGRVHVRRLDAADTVRWSWAASTRNPELFAVALLAGLAAVPAGVGVPRSPATTAPGVAAWDLLAHAVRLAAVLAVWGVAVLTAEDAVTGRSRPLGRRAGIAVRRVPAVAATGLLVGTAVAVGVAMLVVPGVYVLVRLALAFPACVVDRAGPLASFERGWRLARGDLWTVLGVTVGYVGVVAGVEAVAGLVGGAPAPVGALAGAAAYAVVTPVFGLAVGHLYLQNSHNQ